MDKAKVYECFLRDLIFKLRETAAEAGRTSAETAADWDRGRECGLREALSWMQHYATTFEIPQAPILLDGFDAMIDRVEPPEPGR